MLMKVRKHSAHESSGSSRASSETRNQLDYSGHGLHSVQGAEQVIRDLRTRRFVSRLLLPHNELGDAGCIALFQYLTSNPTSVISEITLTSNSIGNLGLLSIIEYLKDNRTLRKLSLQYNKFTSDDLVNQPFVDAINSSCLESLQFATNPGLGDRFIEFILPKLNSATLQELNISSMHLTPTSLPYIIDYLSSHRCRLEIFGCSANALSTPGVRTVVQSVEKHNYRLRRLDIFSNHGQEEEIDSTESRDEWRATYFLLSRVLTRNAQLKRETEVQAFRLLRYARAVLLRPASPLSSPPQTPASSPSTSDVNPFPSHHIILPTELQHHILSFFAPNLSPAQLFQVYAYASSLATLPGLLPRLQHLPPLNHPRENLATSSPTAAGGSETRVPPGCSIGYCTGLHSPTMTSKECTREKWLAAVGCDSYQPERSTSGH